MNYDINYIFQKDKISIGRRKKAISRVFFTPGNGNLIINKIPGENYLHYNITFLDLIWAPLKVLNLDQQVDVIVSVNGGGLKGQTDAIQLSIARLICKLDVKNRQILKPLGFLTRDARVKERKKYGLRKARKAPQFSKR